VREPIPFYGHLDVEPEPRYCSSCEKYRDPTDGIMVKSANGKVNRFKCGFCVKKLSAPRFARKPK